jgi:D-arabinitol 4-dehydrogenase|tara:strand:- start:388 stop:1602 length:1215 start_codon:yes stop_codon:yes gene_type:complete
MYIDEYMEKTGDLRWGIVAVNLMNEGFRDIHDYIVKTPSTYKLVRSHLDYVDWTKNRTVAKHMLTLPSVHLITITVTESGYRPGSPLFEYLACGLRNRKTPITIMCCDNIRQNGLVLKTHFLAYLYHTNQYELAEWIRENVKFPSCMVDRITPRPSEKLKREVERIFPGYGHNSIQTEEFTQWVIEDKFASEFPDLTQVGVTITDNIEPYEETKIRILNGGHTSLAYLGVLSGYNTFDEVMNDKDHREHFRNLQMEEIVPSIDHDLPFDIYEYVDTIEKRFTSSTNMDDLERICMDGFTKFHTFIVPSIRACLEKNKRPIHIYKSIAAWYIYARKFAKGCSKIKYTEPNWILLEPLLKDGVIDSFVSNERLWGDIPKNHITFTRDLKTILLSHTYEKEIDLIGE